MPQRVRPEVCSLYAQFAKPVTDDGVNGRGSDRRSRCLRPDEDLGVRHAWPNVVDVSAQSLRHGRHQGIDLGLTALEAPNVQPPRDPVDLIEPQ